MPHGASWSRTSSTLPSAPAATARSMKLSGSSTKTSTRTVLVPTAVGVSQPLFSGSPKKNGAPWTVSPTTPPRFHNSVAPSARAYHCAAAAASGTASISEITGWWVWDVIACLLHDAPRATLAHPGDTAAARPGHVSGVGWRRWLEGIWPTRQPLRRRTPTCTAPTAPPSGSPRSTSALRPTRTTPSPPARPASGRAGPSRAATSLWVGSSRSPANAASNGPRVLACRRDRQAEADRGGVAAGGDQPGVGAGEVDPPRPPLDPAPVVGAPPAGGLPGGAVRLAGGRPLRASGQVPDRAGPAAGAAAAVRPHRGAGQVGEHHQPGGAAGSQGGDRGRLRRQPTCGAGPVLRRRVDPAGGAAARPGGPRQRPEPGRGADHQGADRAPTEVRGPPADPSR